MFFISYTAIVHKLCSHNCSTSIPAVSTIKYEMDEYMKKVRRLENYQRKLRIKRKECEGPADVAEDAILYNAYLFP